MTLGFERADKERLDVLAGSRRAGFELQSAVRIVDIAELLRLAPKLKAVEPAGATPTAAEYEALRADVAELHKRLLAISKALTEKVRNGL